MCVVGVVLVGLKIKHNARSVDVLRLSEAERRWLMVRMRMVLQKRAVEVKLGQSFPDLAIDYDRGAAVKADERLGVSARVKAVLLNSL